MLPEYVVSVKVRYGYPDSIGGACIPSVTACGVPPDLF